MISSTASSVIVELLRREAVLLELLRDQVLARDRQLLAPRVAGDLEDLHAVAERRRDGVGDVRRGDEHHVREIVRDLEVVIGERVVLLGVEHLEQRRARDRRGSRARSCRPRPA